MVQVVDAAQAVAGDAPDALSVASAGRALDAADARWQRGSLAPIAARGALGLSERAALLLLPVALSLCATLIAGIVIARSLAALGPRVWPRTSVATVPAPLPGGSSSVALAARAAPSHPGEAGVETGPPQSPLAAAAIVSAPAAVEPAAAGAPAWWTDDRLGEQIQAAVPDGIGRVSVAVRNLRTGASAGFNDSAVMPPASLFKLGVLIEAYRRMELGQLSPDQRVLLLWDDYADGSGVLQGRIGEVVSIGEMLRLMTGVSDNVAALTLIRVLGVDAVNEGFERLGLTHTHYYPDWRPDTTTADDIATLLTALAMGQLGDSEATDEMRDLLGQEQPQAWIQWALPHSVGVAHKSGQLPGVRNDAAIVYGPGGPYVLVVLTDHLADEATGEDAIGTIAAAVNAYFAVDR